MIRAELIVKDLDKHAAEFNFPVPGNSDYLVADMRLTAWRGEDDWLIVFEYVAYGRPSFEFSNGVYAYGSCLQKQGYQGYSIVLNSSPSNPLWDPQTNECVANWAVWRVMLNGQDTAFAPSLAEYEEAAIEIARPSGRGSIKEIEILRFLVHRLRHPFFASDRELLRYAPACRGLHKLLQTREWQHPDIAEEESPSQNISMRSLVTAIAENDPREFNPGSRNTDWTTWARFEGDHVEA